MTYANSQSYDVAGLEFKTRDLDSSVLFFFSSNFLFYIEIEPIANVLIFSGEQWRKPAIHIHVSILSQPLFHPGCLMTMGRVPCALQ